jgi:hypothetical protein
MTFLGCCNKRKNLRLKARKNFRLKACHLKHMVCVVSTVLLFLSQNYTDLHAFQFSQQTSLPVALPSKLADSNYRSSLKPSVSFIVASTLRPTLNRTLASLKNHTRSDAWEAILGIDVQMIPNTTLLEIDDTRVRLQLVVPPSRSCRNCAGLIRNIMVLNAAKGEWIAFVDDDDTISPYYIEWLQDITKWNSEIDLIVFRMKRYQRIFPRPGIKTAIKNQVGISFAVKRVHFVSRRVKFVPGTNEDFYFLWNSQDAGLNLKIANCTAYFVRQLPEDKPGSCSIEDLNVL